MREPMTLSRTVSLHGPSVRPTGAKTTSRGSALPGLDALSEPGSLGRRVALLAGLFVLGLALGWLVTQPFAGRASQPVTMSEYSTVVALLYQRDHNLDLARERLTLFGTPADLVGSATRDSSVTAPADQAALATLGQALTGKVTTDQATTTSTAAQPTDAADNQAAAGVASSQSATASSQHSSLLGPILAFVFALLLGSVVLLRTAGLSASSLGLASLRLMGSRSNERRAPRGTIRVETVRPHADSGASDQMDDLAPTSDRVASSSRSGRPVIEVRPAQRASSEHAVADQRNGDRRSAARTRIPSFQSAYHLGDDPYDEIHPITDPTTGSLVAACGLSAALKHSGRGSEYFAFTAWLQNYADDEQLNAAGLVAPGARDLAGDEIQSWVRGGQIDALVPIEKGMRAELGNGELSATVTILDAAFGDQPGAPRSYLEKLVVRFDVRA